MDHLDKLGLVKLLPNCVMRLRKQAKSDFQKVLITDEANLSTVFHKYNWMTVFILDNVDPALYVKKIQSFIENLKIFYKSQKVIIIYCCGYSNFLSRYSCSSSSSSSSSSSDKCCNNCDLYATNRDADPSGINITTIKKVIHSIIPSSYFVPVALPPFDIKWHFEQFLISHKSCCSHLETSSIDVKVNRSLLQNMQNVLNNTVNEYNKEINKLSNEENLPSIDWTRAYLTNSSLSEKQLNIVDKITSLISDAIHSYHNRELELIQNSINESVTEIKQEPDSQDSSKHSNIELNCSGEHSYNNTRKSLDATDPKCSGIQCLNPDVLQPTSSKNVNIIDVTTDNILQTKDSVQLSPNVIPESPDVIYDDCSPEIIHSINTGPDVSPDIIQDDITSESTLISQEISDIICETPNLLEIKSSKREDEILKRQDSIIIINDNIAGPSKSDQHVKAISLVDEEDAIVDNRSDKSELVKSKTEEFVPISDIKIERDFKKRKPSAPFNDNRNSGIQLDDAEISEFKRIVEEGSYLTAIITDDRLSNISEVMDKDENLVNIIHLYGENVLIPQMNNAVLEALKDVYKIRINKKKKLIVAICLGSVDIMQSVSNSDNFNTSSSGQYNFTDHEVIDVVFNRLARLKQSILTFKPDAFVPILKLPMINNKKVENKFIKRLNERIHANNRSDTILSQFNMTPLKELRSVTSADYTLSLEECKHQVTCCMKLCDLHQNKSDGNMTITIDDGTKRKSVHNSSKGSRKRPKFVGGSFLNKHDNIICSTSFESYEETGMDEGNNNTTVDSEMVPPEPVTTIDDKLKSLLEIIKNSVLVGKIRYFVQLLKEEVEILPEVADLTFSEKISILLSIALITNSAVTEPLIDLLNKCDVNKKSRDIPPLEHKEKLVIIEILGAGYKYLPERDLHPHLQDFITKSMASIKKMAINDSKDP